MDSINVLLHATCSPGPAYRVGNCSKDAGGSQWSRSTGGRGVHNGRGLLQILFNRSRSVLQSCPQTGAGAITVSRPRPEITVCTYVPFLVINISTRRRESTSKEQIISSWWIPSSDFLVDQAEKVAVSASLHDQDCLPVSDCRRLHYEIHSHRRGHHCPPLKTGFKAENLPSFPIDRIQSPRNRLRSRWLR